MYLQLDTNFSPFTYDEMVKPLLYYKQAYDEAEAAYSDLVTQTETWRDIANREKSPEAFEMYQRYSGDLQRAVDDFSQGMNLKNRSALLELKRRYAQDITPIAKASEAMNTANKLRIDAGPDAIFEVGEYNSVDQFLHGKTANNKYQSKEALTKRTAAITEAAMAEALRDPEFRKAMNDQFFVITQHTGGSYEDLIEAMKLGMLDNPIAQNRFSQIRQKIAKDSNIQNYDTAGQRAIMDAIDTGLYAGLDKPVKSLQANADHITPAQAHTMALQDAEFKFNAASNGMYQLPDGSWAYDPKADPAVARMNIKAAMDAEAAKQSASQRTPMLKDPIAVATTGDAINTIQVINPEEVNGVYVTFDSLNVYDKNRAYDIIGEKNEHNYLFATSEKDIYGGANDEPVLYIIPKTIVNTEVVDDDEDAY